MKKIVFGAVVAVLASTSAAAQSSDNAQGTATATVVAPIQIVNDGGELSFGVFVPSATAGTVSVATNGARSGTSVSLATGGVVSADAFTVTGTADRTFSISSAATNVASGANTMALTIDAPTSATLTGGTYALNVGGTLTVGANQPAGDYQGIYTMTVAYN